MSRPPVLIPDGYVADLGARGGAPVTGRSRTIRLRSSLDQRRDGGWERPAGRRINAGCASRSRNPIGYPGTSRERIQRSHCDAASPAAPQRDACGACSNRAAASTCLASACSIHCIGIGLRITPASRGDPDKASARLMEI